MATCEMKPREVQAEANKIRAGSKITLGFSSTASEAPLAVLKSMLQSGTLKYDAELWSTLGRIVRTGWECHPDRTFAVVAGDEFNEFNALQFYLNVLGDVRQIKVEDPGV